MHIVCVAIEICTGDDNLAISFLSPSYVLDSYDGNGLDLAADASNNPNDVSNYL